MARSFAPAANAPFLRLLLPLLTGILLSKWIALSVYLLSGVILIFLITVIICKKIGYKYQPVWGLLVFIVLMLIGMTRVEEKRRRFEPLPDNKYFAVAEDFPEAKEKSYKIICELLQHDCKMILWLPKEDVAANVQPGDVIEFRGEPATIENNGNPYEFDYKGYLNSKQIGYQLFLKKNQYQKLQSVKLMNISRHSMVLRSQIIERLRNAGLKDKSLPLVASIAFGARDEVDREDVQSFTNTGVIHVLAVSGLNVGLIFVILDALLAFLKWRRSGRLLYFGIMYVAIWGYALITGMSASILRAAFMFSFVLTGMAFSRKSNIFNTLACSIFLLLAWDPALFGDVGFQLSYAAVLAIVLIQPKIYQLFWFKNKIADKLWLMIAVTFAAQLGTLPLTLSYFHQFPLYFWIANIIVIPLVTLILYLSFVLLFLSFFSQFLSLLTVWLLNLSIQIVLGTVHLVENFPVAVLRNLYPTAFELLLTACILFGIWNFFRTKRAINLHFVLFLLISLTANVGWKLFERRAYKEIIFFNIPGTKAVVLQNDLEAFVLYDRCNQPETKLPYAMQPYFGWNGINKVSYMQLADSLRVRIPGLSVVGNRINYYGCTVQFQSNGQHLTDKADDGISSLLVWKNAPNEGETSPFSYKPSHLILNVGSTDIPMIRSKEKSEYVVNEAVRVKIFTGFTTMPRSFEICYFRQ